jgi:hypothetical protein
VRLFLFMGSYVISFYSSFSVVYTAEVRTVTRLFLFPIMLSRFRRGVVRMILSCNLKAETDTIIVVLSMAE